jgi:hypothetical protein
MHCQATGEYGFEVFFFCVCSITDNSPRVLPSGKAGAVHSTKPVVCLSAIPKSTFIVKHVWTAASL